MWIYWRSKICHVYSGAVCGWLPVLVIVVAWLCCIARHWTRMLDCARPMVNSRTWRSDIWYVVLNLRGLVRIWIFCLHIVLTGIQRTASRSNFVRRILDFVGFVRWCLLERLALLVIDLTISVAWHYWTRCSHVWMLKLKVVLCGNINSCFILLDSSLQLTT